MLNLVKDLNGLFLHLASTEWAQAFSLMNLVCTVNAETVMLARPEDIVDVCCIEAYFAVSIT